MSKNNTIHHLLPLLERVADLADRSPLRVEVAVNDVVNDAWGRPTLGRTGGFGRRQLWNRGKRRIEGKINLVAGSAQHLHNATVTIEQTQIVKT